MPILGFLHIAIAIYFAVHAVRTGRNMEMNGVDGFETATRLQTATGERHPALFALTGNDRLRDLASRDSRFTASILKPADVTGLLKLLEKVSAAL